MTEKQIRLSAGPIRYRDIGHGEPLLFVHGLLVNGLLWRKLTPLLAQRYRCIVPDWPLGSHDRPMSAEADLSPTGLTRLIVEFIAGLGMDDVTLVGNDTGGALCQLVAAENPERVARMVLTSCDAYESFPPRFLKYVLAPAQLPGVLFLMMQVLRIRALRSTPIAFGWLQKSPLDHDVVDAYIRPSLTDSGVRRDVMKILRKLDPAYTIAAAEKLRTFDHPVLLAWAADDRVFPVSLGRRLVRDLPRAQLELVEDSYTFISEDQPERLAELIEKFAS